MLLMDIDPILMGGERFETTMNDVLIQPIGL
jgi:hypothetical protein